MIEPFVHITGVASSVVLSIATKDLSVKQPINLAYPPPLPSPPTPLRRCWTSCRTAGCFYGWHCYHYYLPIYQYRPRNLCFTIWQRWKKRYMWWNLFLKYITAITLLKVLDFYYYLLKSWCITPIGNLVTSLENFHVIFIIYYATWRRNKMREQFL